VGRVGLLEEAIEQGRGKARVGDTLWTVEGQDSPVGAQERITAAHGTVLKVEGS
jgi:membrane protein implicated in regulation of membrane protease activity